MEEREYASREDVEDTRAIGYGVNPAVWIVLALAVVFAVAAALLQPKSTPESEAERLAEAVFGSAANVTKVTAEADGTSDMSTDRMEELYSNILDEMEAGDYLSREDIIGAKENRLDSIGVLYGYGDREELSQAGADYIVEDIAGLRNLLFHQ